LSLTIDHLKDTHLRFLLVKLSAGQRDKRGLGRCLLMIVVQD
jgi:hypothetical protein